MTATSGHLLLADDDETFRKSTADLLRREGYVVDAVADGTTALERVRDGSYDLLISDLQMPGNQDLALVRELAHLAGGLPVIIVTGFPTADSAIQSIELPVCAYLVKPFDVELLKDRAGAAIARFRSFQAMRRAEQRLANANEELRGLRLAREAAGVGGHSAGVDAFLALTLRNVMGSLTDLEQLGHALAGQAPHARPCQLIDCPRGTQLHAAVLETIQVLEETKSAFKSKTLADLRHKLELLIQHC